MQGKADEEELAEEQEPEKADEKQIPLHRIRQIVLEVHDQPLDTCSILTNKSGRLDHIVEFLQYHGFTVSVEQQISKVTSLISSFFRSTLSLSPPLGVRRHGLLYVHPLGVESLLCLCQIHPPPVS
jgi:hypothetical protein